MNKILLNILVWLEQKRNDLLWSLFEHFFYHSYDYLDLKDKYSKYRKIAYNEKIHDHFDEQAELLRKAQYEKQPIEIWSSNYFSPNIKVLDLTTGEFIERCVYANQTTGEHIYYNVNSKGKMKKHTNFTNLILVYDPIEEKG